MASRTSQAAILNHHHHQQPLGLFENQEGEGCNTQTDFFPFPQNLTFSSLPLVGHQSLKGGLSTASIASDDAPSTTTLSETLVPRPSLTPPLRHKQDHNITTSSEFGGGGGGGGGGPHGHLLSLQRSTANLWAWGDVSDEYCLSSKRSSGGDDSHHPYLGGLSAMKMKKMKAIRRKVREPRFCFKTLSDVDVLDDGYKWRKYGQKVVKNTQHPRSYYRCTMDNCRVKKRVERLAEDPRMVITTYEGRHVHSPSHDLDDQDSRSPSHLNNFFW
ncbi:hypothetical protein FF1_019323 [Malus domestica]|uniref:WRKY domain-containing protein n=1 Tax=Malus domestica TaxID=3750 RepID=A0A498HYP5_MALDO|nr:hypothetical protein DVH24_039448 [Malus domestica]